MMLFGVAKYPRGIIEKPPSNGLHRKWISSRWGIDGSGTGAPAKWISRWHCARCCGCRATYGRCLREQGRAARSERPLQFTIETTITLLECETRCRAASPITYLYFRTGAFASACLPSFREFVHLRFPYLNSLLGKLHISHHANCGNRQKFCLCYNAHSKGYFKNKP